MPEENIENMAKSEFDSFSKFLFGEKMSLFLEKMSLFLEKNGKKHGKKCHYFWSWYELICTYWK